MDSRLTESRSDEQLYPVKLLCRFVFVFIFLSLLYSFYSHALLHQMAGPVLKYPYVDPTYWIFHLLRWPEYLTGHSALAWTFDIALFLFCILSLLYPRKRLFIFCFFVLYGIYFLITNTYSGHHSHSKVGILLITVPFIFTDRAFACVWPGLRYFTLFIYADAFLWKLFRSSWLHKDQGVLIVKKNLTPYLYFDPQTLQAKFYYWLLEHPAFTNTLYITGFLLEGLFIIGFFTKRFDKYLATITILLVTGFYIIADAFAFELLILTIPLLSTRNISGNRL